MPRLVLASAATLLAALSAAPAQAQLAAGSGGQFVQPGGTNPFGVNLHRRSDGDDRPDRRNRSTVVLGTYGGEWALYNNRSFEPDSYNDWWHDRTDRSYPRWVQNNGNCERQWWGGGSLRC